jgi:hypothetical protein
MPTRVFGPHSTGSAPVEGATMLLLARMMAVIAVLAATTAGAAEPAYPPGSRIGLVPVADLVPSRVFRGFEDAKNGVAALLFQLPAEAYREEEISAAVEGLKGTGFSLEKSEPFALASGKAVLVTGTRRADEGTVRHWYLFASIGDVTALVTVIVPERARQVYSDMLVREALATVAVRPEPIQEQLQMLPFTLGELSGFRVVRAGEQASVLLTEGSSDLFTAAEQPHVLISAAPMPQVAAEDRGTFARDLLLETPSFKDFRITFAEPLRLGGGQGYEVRADARDVQTGADVSLVQWLRFGSGGFMRVLGITPKDKRSEMFPRFRAIRDGVAPR